MIQGIERKWTEQQANQSGWTGWARFLFSGGIVVFVFAMVFGSFAINTLSYSWALGTLAVFAYFFNRQFRHTRTVSVHLAFKAGIYTAILFAFIAHAWAYHTFKDYLFESLSYDQPGYLDVDWNDPPDRERVYQLYVQHVSANQLSPGWLTSLQLRAAAGVDVTLRGNRAMGVGRKVVATWVREGFSVWLLFILQIFFIVIACVGSTLAAASMREVALEDKFGLNPVPQGSDVKQTTHAPDLLELAITPGTTQQKKKQPHDLLSSVHMDQVRSSLDNGTPAYLVILQRFRSGGGYSMFKTSSELNTAKAALDNSGQRYPGLVIHCTAINTARKSKRCIPLDSYCIDIGSIVIVAAAPTATFINALGQQKCIQDRDRVEIIWVARPKQSLKQAKKILKQAPYDALIGVCEYIADSEQGSFDRYSQNDLNSIGIGNKL